MIARAPIEQPLNVPVLPTVWVIWLTALVNAVNDAQTPRTVDQLPPAPAEGQQTLVTDSTTAVWGAAIAGGGANRVGARWNGTNWTVFSI